MYVDFHIHTTYSDGGKTFEEIISLCKENNIGYISITDHNTFKVYKRKFDSDIKILKGIELDVKYNKNLTLHMLLYDFNLNSKLLKKYYKNNRRYEIRCFNSMIREVEKKNNIKLDSKKVKKFIKTNNYFDRVRLNNLLVECGLSKDPESAFYSYTKDIKEHKRKSITMKELFKLEKDSKGIVAIAHPLRYSSDIKYVEQIILNLKEKYNLRVVEAINNRQTLPDEKELLSFCKKNNLYVSAGSDAHYKFGEKVNKSVGLILNRKITEEDTNFLKLLKNKSTN